MNTTLLPLCLIHCHVTALGLKQSENAATENCRRLQQFIICDPNSPNHEYLIDNITHPQALVSLSRREPFLLALYSVSTRRCHGTGDK